MYSRITPTKISPDEKPRDAKGYRAIRHGLAYTPEEVLRFCNTIHNAQLPFPEVVEEKVVESEGISSKDSLHFKILLVEEWKSTWKLGLKDGDNKRRYEGVEDHKFTKPIYDEPDDDADQTDDDQGDEDAQGDEDNIDDEY